jgi:hypothetical protein
MDINETKLALLKEVHSLESTIANKLRILRALDKDDSHSGCYDIHDQLNSMEESLSGLAKSRGNAEKVVPTNA